MQSKFHQDFLKVIPENVRKNIEEYNKQKPSLMQNPQFKDKWIVFNNGNVVYVNEEKADTNSILKIIGAKKIPGLIAFVSDNPTDRMDAFNYTASEVGESTEITVTATFTATEPTEGCPTSKTIEKVKVDTGCDCCFLTSEDFEPFYRQQLQDVTMSVGGGTAKAKFYKTTAIVTIEGHNFPCNICFSTDYRLLGRQVLHQTRCTLDGPKQTITFNFNN